VGQFTAVRTSGRHMMLFEKIPCWNIVVRTNQETLLYEHTWEICRYRTNSELLVWPTQRHCATARNVCLSAV